MDRNLPEDNGFYRWLDPEPLDIKKWVADDYEYQSTSIYQILNQMSDDERLEVFNRYCKHCGSKVLPCYCSKDE